MNLVDTTDELRGDSWRTEYDVKKCFSWALDLRSRAVDTTGRKNGLKTPLTAPEHGYVNIETAEAHLLEAEKILKHTLEIIQEIKNAVKEDGGVLPYVSR